MKKLLIIGLVVFAAHLIAQPTTEVLKEKELGQVEWYRNYDEAFLKAQKDSKPILLFFQEVPGCSTCRNYGYDVMSDPILVDMIENEFIPLCIYNNASGHDANILKKYNEPSWNNPVIRILDEEGNSKRRIAGKYKNVEVLEEINAYLKEEQKLPAYASLYYDELRLNHSDETVFTMYCFWSGEAKLGDIKGVIATESGWVQGAEVVKVKSDPNTISKTALIKKAEELGLEQVKDYNNFRSDKDPQYYLKHSEFASLPLLEIQKSKINAALYAKRDASKFLSPSQSKWLKLQMKEINYTKDFSSTWWKLRDNS